MSEIETIEKLQERWDFYRILVLERKRLGIKSHHLVPAMAVVTSLREIEKFPRVVQGRYTVRYKDGTMWNNVPLFYPHGDMGNPLMTYIEAKGVSLQVKVYDLGLLIAKEKKVDSRE